MIERLAALIVDESKWLTASMGLALLMTAALLARHRRLALPAKRRALAAMNLFFGITIGTMAFGHLLAVTAKLAQGSLEGSAPVVYLIGVALALPATWVILNTRRILAPGDAYGPSTLRLSTWLVVTLLALGPQNLPLAAPGLLNIGYHLSSRRAVGWVILGLAVVVNLGLFIGSLVFFASGQTFEQFSGMP